MFIVIYGAIQLESYEKGFKLVNTVKFKSGGKKFIMLKGFITDLGSIPRPLRNLFSRFGLSTDGYVLHDFGYRVQPINTDRKFWDDTLLEFMKYKKENYFKRYSIYWGLRLFGWIAWENNKKIKGDLFG